MKAVRHCAIIAALAATAGPVLAAPPTGHFCELGEVEVRVPYVREVGEGTAAGNGRPTIVVWLSATEVDDDAGCVVKVAGERTGQGCLAPGDSPGTWSTLQVLWRKTGGDNRRRAGAVCLRGMKGVSAFGRIRHTSGDVNPLGWLPAAVVEVAATEPPPTPPLTPPPTPPPVDPATLPAPTGVSVTATCKPPEPGGAVQCTWRITWNAVAGASSYEVATTADLGAGDGFKSDPLLSGSGITGLSFEGTSYRTAGARRPTVQRLTKVRATGSENWSEPVRFQ